MMESIMLLLDELEGYLQECNNLPFSSKVVVNMEVLYEFMTDLRMKLPEEVKRSKRIIDERDKIILGAEEAADEIVGKAEKRALEILDEHELRKEAIKQAEELVIKAEQTAREIKDGGYRYVDELLSHSEHAMKDTLIKTSAQFSKFEEYMKEHLEVIAKNRLEIRQED